MTLRTKDHPVSTPGCGVASAVSIPPDARARRGSAAWHHGIHAEQAACQALEKDGWIILCRRARTEAGEIDIVAHHAADRLTAFIEVKARPSLAGAAHSLTSRQQARLRAAAEILLARNPDWPQDGLRFDLLLVDRTGTVRRIADVFRDEG